MIMTTSASDRPTLRRWISWATLASLFIAQATLFGAVAADGSTTGSDPAPAASNKLEFLPIPAGPPADRLGASDPAGQGPWSLIGDRRAGICESSVATPLAGSAKGDPPIVAPSAPGLWRQELKSSPERRTPGQDAGRVISPTGPVNLNVDPRGRWVTGYRPNTPQAQAEYDRWQNEQRLSRLEGTDTGRKSRDGSPQGNLFPTRERSGSTADEEQDNYAVHEQRYEVTQIDPRQVFDAEPEIPRERNVDPSGIHRLSGLTWDEYVQVKLMADLLPETPGAQIATVNRAPSGFGVSFDAIANTAGGTPPDPIMTAGPNDLIAIVNSRYRVFDKLGNPRGGEITLNTLFAGISECQGSFDVFADYDEEYDRFVLGSMTLTNGGDDSYLCVAASATNDPTGTWNRTSFRSDGVDTAYSGDFPHMGIGLDAIYFAQNMFTDGAGSTFDHVNVYAVDKFDLYAGTPAAVAEDTLTLGYFTGQPAKIHGYSSGGWPAPGTPHHIIASDGLGQARIWRWINPFVQGPTVYGNVIGLAYGGVPPLAPESGDSASSTVDYNDTGSGSWLDAEYRDGRLWATRGVACSIGGGNSEACVDWIQVDVSGASPALEQQQSGGAYGSADDFRYYPDVSVDRNNNIAIGYTKSSLTTFTELWVTGREFGDAAGTLQAEASQIAGTGNYTDGAGCGGACDRWGDYSGMVIDPDGCTFWYLGEYSNGGVGAWRTHIGSYKFDSCSVDSQVKLDQSTYTCGGNLTATVSDSIAINAATVSAQTVITTTSGDSETIPAGSWSGSDCVGSECTTWVAVVPISGSSGFDNDGVINVANGGTITTDYTDPHVTHDDQSRSAAVNCQTQLDDGGFLIDGGCELETGTELYRDYIDGGEYIAYTFGALNPAASPSLTDVYATLSIAGPAADKVTIFNPTIYIGNVAQATLTAPVFNLYVDPSIDTASLRMSEHDFELSITSPADGYTVPQVLTQQQVLQADDHIETLSECFNFEAGDQGFIQDNYVASWETTGLPPITVNTTSAPWTRGTGCLSETRTDHPDCAANGSYAFKTSSDPAACGNFTQAADLATDDIIYSPILTPTYTGDAGTNQPWQYRWVAAEYFYRSDMVTTADDPAMIWGQFFANDYQGTATPAQNEVDTQYPFFSGWSFRPNQDWDSATAWDPDNPPANFGTLSFSSDAGGPATSGMQWRWAIEAYDADWGGDPLTTDATQGLAIDNLSLVYDQYHIEGQVGTCTSAPATLSFDQFTYQECSSGTLTITVLDGNATGPLTVTVTSAGGGDSETLVIAGPGPDFTTTLAYDTAAGVADDDGTLLVTPEDTVVASHDDTDPVATVTTGAFIVCDNGDVIVDGVAGLQDNGDDDQFADTNEVVDLSIRLKNNTELDLTNAVAVIATDDPNIECVTKDSASFGTIGASGGTSTNDLLSDPFTFKVANSAICTDPTNPLTATFQVFILADGFSGASAPQSFTLTLDLNDLPGTVTFTEDFTTEPTVFYHELGPGDDDGAVDGPDPGGLACSPYVDLFFWRATGGNPGGGFFCWEDPVDNFPDGDYKDLNDSALYSPTLKIGATSTTLSFDHEYRFSTTDTFAADGARVDYRLNGGAWQKLTSPDYDSPLIYNYYCNPLCNGGGDFFTPCFSEAESSGEDVFALFNNDVQNWTNDALILSGLTSGDQVQFRWRVGSMNTSAYAIPATLGGYGLDNVSVTNVLAQECDTAINPDEGCGVAFDSAGNLIEICGDGDLVVEPTEQWSVDVTLKNSGSTDAVDTAADLAVNAGSAVLATVSGNPGSYGTIVGGGTASASYGLTVDAGAICVNDIVFDVTGISDFAQSYPDNLAAFSVQVGAISAGETANQLADPLDAAGGSVDTLLSPDFTLAGPVDMATLDYSSEYRNSAASETATQDTDPIVAFNSLTVVSSLSPAFTTTVGDVTAATVDWSTLTAVGTPGSLTDCARVFLRTPNATDIDLKPFGVAAANPYDVLSIYQGVNGGPGQYTIGVQEQSGQCKLTVTLGGTSMAVDGAIGTGTWTANARVSLNDGTSWHVIKEYGVADASPYDVTSIYNAAGPGTYQIRVGENGAGGTASLNSGSMTIQNSECDLGCTSLPPAPPLADGATGTAMTMGKGVADDDLVFNIDNLTCSSDHAVVLYGNLGDFSGYQGAVDTGCDIGSGPTGNASHVGDNVWFQVIWVNADDAAGHPGWATSGARSWNALGLCSVSSDDSSDEVCN